MTMPLSRRQFLLRSLGLTLVAVAGGTALALRRPTAVEAPSKPPTLTLVDHDNLREYKDVDTSRLEVALIRRNLDQAARLGVGTYILFASETFEAMLTYDFALDGVGDLGRVFSGDSKQRQVAGQLRGFLNEVIAYAKTRNIRILFHTNQFEFPDAVYSLVQDQLVGTTGRPVCPGREATWQVYRGKLAEFFRFFPDIGGLVLTGDESDTSVMDCLCDYCRHLDPLARITRLTTETATAAGSREVQMRVWQNMEALTGLDPGLMTAGLPPTVYVSLKNTAGDFLLSSPFDERRIGAGDPSRQIIEFDAWREYEGHNFFPCYMGDVWGPRIKTCVQRGIPHFAVRLNWNHKTNHLFEQPWGNLVNLLTLHSLIQQPKTTPDDALKGYLAAQVGITADDALIALYKFTPDFARAIYYDNKVYLGHHSRLPKNVEVTQEIYANVRQTLSTVDDFARRRREVDTAYARLLTFIEQVGEQAPPSWREAWRRGGRIGWLVGMGLANQYQAVSESRAEPGLRERMLHNEREWQTLDSSSYEQLRGETPRIILDQA